MKPHGYFLVLLSLAVLSTPAGAQEVKVGGQLRPRYEYRDPHRFTAGEGEGGEAFVSMRTRADLRASLPENVNVLIQLQDVRLWGEESGSLTDFSAAGLDLHQGYVDLNSREEGKFRGRFGRQEVNFGGQRLIGAVGWTQQGRSFDGIRLGSEGSAGRIDVLASQLGNGLAPEIDRDAELLSGYGTVNVAEDQTVDVYWIFDHADAEEDDGTQTNQHTLGARWVGRASDFVYRAEGSYQTGERFGTDVKAFMLGARLGYDFGAGTVTLWYDYLSGDDDATDSEIRVFDTLFATNHKFYGFADLFLNIPLHTAAQGLQDFALKGTATAGKDWRLLLDVHSFRLAERRALDSSHLGEEIDVVATYRYSENVNVHGGVAYVFQDDAWAEIGRLFEDMTWVYVMLDVKF